MDGLECQVTAGGREYGLPKRLCSSPLGGSREEQMATSQNVRGYSPILGSSGAGPGYKKWDWGEVRITKKILPKQKSGQNGSGGRALYFESQY
jgi:hypothetical protein